MGLWGDKELVELLLKENADLKEQNKQLVDAVLSLKGVKPAFAVHEKPPVGKSRVSLNAMAKRLEQFEQVNTTRAT